MSSVRPLGTHLLIDFWGCRSLDDISYIELALTRAAAACGAQVLQTRLHSFGEKSGVTGVALLAESHISIHTWPEHSFAALDIFMCGQCDPHLALPVLQGMFTPTRFEVATMTRGGNQGIMPLSSE